MTFIDIEKKFFSLGVLGKQISYSLSPLIYNTWFDCFGLSGRCDLIQKDFFDFEDISEEIRKYDGWAVTVPYKEKMFEWLKRQSHSSWDALVDSVGIVNIIKNYQGGVEATNTDAKALDFLLPQDRQTEEFKNILIFGNGGVAKTTKAVFVKGNADASVFNVCRFKGDSFEEKKVSFNNLKSLEGINFDIVVNATPLGTLRCRDDVLLSQIDDFLSSQNTRFMVDWAYDRKPTFFESVALKRQVSFIGGLDLLIQQAAFAFEFWFGLVPPIDLAKQAIQKALKS